ncbi:MAG: trimeric intracellular cation channel family protein [Lachnospiraceae bacterium]|nr:trimeric intracellular cation channel family protein [Lachnospiraceae bacterium]
MKFDVIFFIFEMIGTVAFAISGVLVAKEKKMDLFGAIVLGCATAVGGGVIRDLLLGQTPPVMFQEPVYVAVAFVTCVVDFIILRHKIIKADAVEIHRVHAKSEFLLNAADAVGLAAFVVVGCRTAVNAGYEDNTFLVIFVGVLTGIGGGILRDILAGQMPLIMKKRVYGVAALAGAIVYAYAETYINVLAAAIISMVLITLIRFLAIHYRWNLPSFDKRD